MSKSTKGILAMMMARMFGSAVALGLLSLASCGNSVSPASQAVAAVHVAQLSSGSGLNCTPGPHWAGVPATAAVGQQVTATFAGKRAVDGEDGMSVKCAVVASGDKFNVSATLRSPAVDSSGNAISSTNMVLSTTIGADDSAAPGSVLLADEQTGTQFTGDCSFSVKRVAGNEGYAVQAGKIWGTVTCTKLSDLGAVGSGCRVDQGYFVLENCDE